MKIAAYSIPDIKLGKHNVKDGRLDQVDKLVKAKKKTYVQVEVVGEDSMRDADAILTSADGKMDLILKDLEFVETRLGRTAQEEEKALLTKLKTILEKEELVNKAEFSAQEKEFLAPYALFTGRAVVIVEPADLEDLNGVLFRALQESSYISFFTAGEKETRAWLIRRGATAWEAAGVIHSDIQQGFIRAEIIAFDDYIAAGGETPAKQAGKLRLEQKEYVMKDTDLANFRFNK